MARHVYPTSIYFDDETMQALLQLQERLGLSRSATIRYAIHHTAKGGEHIADKLRGLAREMNVLVGNASDMTE